MPRYLFLTPIHPAPTGNGLAMRAWQIRQALAALGSVRTCVVPVAEGVDWQLEAEHERVWRLSLPDPQAAAVGWLSRSRGRSLLGRIQDLPQRARLASPVVGEALLKTQPREPPWDGLVVLRGYLAGVALPLLECGLTRRAVLDFDECDHRLPLQLGKRAEAEVWARFNGAVASWFDDIAFSSAVEIEAARELSEHEGRLWPNVIDERTGRAEHRDPTEPRLLYVGNQDYAPNRDALGWLLREGFPAIRAARPDAVLQVVGQGAEDLGPEAGPGVEWLGYVDDLGSQYAGAAGALAPLRYGVGTRIKLLEAFAHGVPVVASPVAAEGLAVAAGRELLLAEVGPGFPAAVGAMLDDPIAAGRRADQARAFVRRHHAPAVLRRAVAETFAAAPA